MVHTGEAIAGRGAVSSEDGKTRLDGNAAEIQKYGVPSQMGSSGVTGFFALGRLERMVVFLYSDWNSRVLLATVHITRELLHSRIPGLASKPSLSFLWSTAWIKKW